MFSQGSEPLVSSFITLQGRHMGRRFLVPSASFPPSSTPCPKAKVTHLLGCHWSHSWATSNWQGHILRACRLHAKFLFYLPECAADGQLSHPLTTTITKVQSILDLPKLPQGLYHCWVNLSDTKDTLYIYLSPLFHWDKKHGKQATKELWECSLIRQPKWT